jgi:hypothetical protein
MQITQVFSVRLAILTLTTPVFVPFTLVALVDGFVQRDLRRWGGGRESSFVYHWAKQALGAAAAGRELGGLPGAAVQSAPDLRHPTVRDPVRPERGGHGEQLQEIFVVDASTC